jgi:glucose-induced degradation protein 8
LERGFVLPGYLSMNQFSSRVPAIGHISPSYSSSLTKSDINNILMDYFILEGYQDVVHEFSNESFSTLHQSHPNMATLESRECIRFQISNGMILESLELIEKEYPELLMDPMTLFQLYEQHFVECLLNNEVLKALNFASEKMIPLAMQSRKLLGKVEEMMTMILFLKSSEEEIPMKYSAKMALDRRYELANDINSLIIQTATAEIRERSEPKLISILKEMVCQQNDLKRKLHLAFPQPEIELL